MYNMLLKARAGRRMALMLRSLRRSGVAVKVDPTAPASPIERPAEHQFLQRVSLSENRVSRLANA